MNILLFNWRDPKNSLSGGAEYVTLEHCKAWVNNGHRVTWFSSSYMKASETDVIDGISYVRRGNAITMFFHAWAYYRAHAKEFDVIVEEVHGIPFFAKLYSHKPIIVFIHEIAGVIWDAMYPIPVSWIGKLLERVFFLIYRKNYFWTDAVTTKKELMARGIREDHCVAIPCPMNVKPVTTPPKKAILPTFLFVGRIVRMKGVEDILNAFAQILRSYPTAMLWIVGDGDQAYIKFLHEKAKHNGFETRVKWWGRVDEEGKLRLMKSSHVLLHASIKEGWGLVVLEAASQGTPTIAYPSGGLNDTIIDGKTGILTVVPTPKAMADAAVRLLTETKTYARMQRKGIEWSTSFTWSDATRQSLRLLNSIK